MKREGMAVARSPDFSIDTFVTERERRRGGPEGERGRRRIFARVRSSLDDFLLIVNSRNEHRERYE